MRGFPNIFVLQTRALLTKPNLRTSQRTEFLKTLSGTYQPQPTFHQFLETLHTSYSHILPHPTTTFPAFTLSTVL